MDHKTEKLISQGIDEQFEDLTRQLRRELWLARLTAFAGITTALGGLLVWWGIAPEGTFEGLVLLAAATVVGRQR